MFGYKKVDINIGKIFYYNERLINRLKKDIVKFLKDKPYMNRECFARRMILSLEIKTNNAVEGEYDDFSVIEQTVKNHCNSSDREKRIVNLYQSYQYILNNKNITKDSLNELYQILSRDLLDDYSLDNMGRYYRRSDVYILNSSGIIPDFDKGLSARSLNRIMNELFNYINNNSQLTKIDHFIKSQIIHYLFVYIHPYFDINGRSSRTLAMWYLLNNKAYPYVIFNRAISLSKEDYINSIRKSRKGNLTPFLTYMLKALHSELEKEYVITHLVKSLTNFSVNDLEILEYILSLDNPTLDSLYNLYIFYNQYMEKEEFKNIKLKPLIKIGIINIDKLSNGKLTIRKEVLRLPKEKIYQLKYINI